MRRILDDRDKTELQDSQQQLREDMSTADALLTSLIELKEEQLTDHIENVNSTLSNTIATTEAELQKNLNTYKSEMATKHQDMINDMTEADEQLQDNIEATEQILTSNLNAYKSEMATKHTEMQTAMNNADTTLQSNIDTVQSTLQQTIETLKNELQANIQNSASTQTTYTDESIAALVNGSPELLNTLNEFAIAIGNDANFAATMATELGKKVDKDGDKVLTDNNLTDELKGQYDTAYSHSQVAHAPSDAEKNVQADWSITDTTSDAYINNKPTALKNPAQLTFTGTVDATYDGSEPITITINDASVVYMRVADGYLQYSNDNELWVNLFALADITAGALSVDENGILVLA